MNDKIYPISTEMTDKGWKINWRAFPKYSHLLSREAFVSVDEAYVSKVKAISDIPSHRATFMLQLQDKKSDELIDSDFYKIACMSRDAISQDEATEFFKELLDDDSLPDFITCLEDGETISVTMNGKKGIVCKEPDGDRELYKELLDEFFVLQIQMKNAISILLTHHIESHTAIAFAQEVAKDPDFIIPPSLFELAKVIKEPCLDLYIALHIRRNKDVVPEYMRKENHGIKMLIEFLNNAKQSCEPERFKGFLEDPQELMEYAIASTSQSLMMRGRKANHRLLYHIAIHNEDWPTAEAESLKIDEVFNDELNILMEASSGGDTIYAGGTKDGVEMKCKGEEVIRQFGEQMVRQHKDRQQFIKNLKTECKRSQIVYEQTLRGML